MDKEESIFIKKYIEILKFKSLIRNQKIKIINPLTSKKKDDDCKKVKLPYIKIIKKNQSNTTRSVPKTTVIQTSDNNNNKINIIKNVLTKKEENKIFNKYTEETQKKKYKSYK